MRRILPRSACPGGRRLKVLASVGLAATLGLGACTSPGSGSGASTSTTVRQKVPAGSEATPARTVSNYLGALARHNAGLAKLFVNPKAQASIVAAAGSGFEHLVSIADIDMGATRTGTQFRPNVNGDTFSKDSQFAQVTVSYTATFSSGQSGSGTLTRIMTLGENTHYKWSILAIRAI
jgi:hypothetical protein